MQTEIVSYVSLGIAVVGAILGLFNSWRAFSNDRVKIRVKASIASLGVGDKRLMIETLNLSTFPITITHIGFTLTGSKRHLQLLPIYLNEADGLPKRLESRTHLAVLAAAGTAEEIAIAGAECVYVKTACGITILGSREELSRVLN